MLAHVSRVQRRRDRGPLRNTSDFVVETRGGLRLHAVRDLPEPIRNELFRQSEASPAQLREDSAEDGHAILTLRLDVPWGEGTTPVMVRRYRPRGVWRALCDRFRRSRALQSWRRGHSLLARGIATSRPLAICDGGHSTTRPWWPRWLWPRESCLAVEWIDGAEDLQIWTWRLATRPSSERLRRAAACAEQLGRLVGRMHVGGVSHRDLRGSSFMIAEHGRELRVWLVDMEGVLLHKQVSARQREVDLVRLAVDVEDHAWVPPSIRYRFLLAYARQFPQGSIDPRQLWRDVAWQARSERRGEKKRAAA
ncbi:MAG TPA: hypothetical protein DD670_21395 [Planctomycetaceae bacterium]|nr:hypothetical protein [Planctomycetaceae bacterium]